MESEKVQTQKIDPTMQSCRKKKSEAADASFLADVRDHIDEFIHASMDEHKTCFQKTIRKMFGMSKAIAERSSSSSSGSDAKEVESVFQIERNGEIIVKAMDKLIASITQLQEVASIGVQASFFIKKRK